MTFIDDIRKFTFLAFNGALVFTLYPLFLLCLNTILQKFKGVLLLQYFPFWYYLFSTVAGWTSLEEFSGNLLFILFAHFNIKIIVYSCFTVLTIKIEVLTEFLCISFWKDSKIPFLLLKFKYEILNLHG